MLIHPVPGDSHTFSHGESGDYSSDAKAFDMAETEACEGGSDNKADHIEADLDPWVSHRGDLGQLPGEKISRYDWHFTAVGDSDSNAEQNIACDEIKDAPANGCRKNVDPQFMYIQHLAEDEAHNEAE